jgi:DNA-binding CsgD family transcriptional regulator
MSREAYFSIGTFNETHESFLTSKLGVYARVVPAKYGQLQNDVRLGLVVHEDDDASANAYALAEASNVPTLMIRKSFSGPRTLRGAFFSTRVDAHGIKPFVCYALARSIVGNERLADAISRVAVKWGCTPRAAEILALLCHTGSHQQLAEMTGHTEATVKSHVRRIIRHAITAGETPQNGQDLARIVLWTAYGRPSMEIAPRDRITLATLPESVPPPPVDTHRARAAALGIPVPAPREDDDEDDAGPGDEDDGYAESSRIVYDD